MTKVWLNFLRCVFFHRKSTVDGCKTCKLDYWASLTPAQKQAAADHMKERFEKGWEP